MGAVVPGLVEQWIVGQEVTVAGHRVDGGAQPYVGDDRLARTVEGQQQVARLAFALAHQGGGGLPRVEKVDPRPGRGVGAEEGLDAVALGGELIAELGVRHP